jgi:hypothetical protein
MELRCGASQSSGCCSNRQSTVKVQGRESEVRGLVVLPGLPVSKGSPVWDERAPGLLSIPAPADEEAVCANNSNQHPNPHIIHHLGISAVPLAYQVGGKPLLGIPGLTSRNSINQIYHGCKSPSASPNRSEGIYPSSPSCAAKELSQFFSSYRTWHLCP